ncbi:hypothetical protein HELRODRAFT_157108 [Helobdella robusta]|uniref:U2A'/phosphoprotein 32 family A C-terminal domain-containing protein n=1 Tax=Helobdella robusta TaxID=6412 RepID=T1EM61_HELRO|nr:hypothetical protein HELRODRAFT_157108 [Helobdella robusta]ESO03272.1 hypothetical protein HELRODRAFT_157108 [Helobdella robusta]
MVKLTQEVIEQAIQFTNPVKDRQLDLRGYKIPAIENLGATLDQFDVIDFTDNEIRKVDNFPLLKRIKCLLLSNNHINRIEENLEINLPNLQSLVLMNNRMTELGDLDVLSSIKSLQSLSLLYNPVAKKKYYRLYLIHKIPQLKRIDFQKVKLKEKEAASELFKGVKGQELLKELGKRSRIVLPAQENVAVSSTSPSKNQQIENGNNVEKEAAIASASTLEEVERLKKLLQAKALANNTAQGFLVIKHYY